MHLNLTWIEYHIKFLQKQNTTLFPGLCLFVMKPRGQVKQTERVNLHEGSLPRLSHHHHHHYNQYRHNRTVIIVIIITTNTTTTVLSSSSSSLQPIPPPPYCHHRHHHHHDNHHSSTNAFIIGPNGCVDMKWVLLLHE